MWTQQQLADDLRELGLTPGSSVLVHGSMRAIGPMEAGADTLLKAFREVLGAEGTLLVSTFTLEKRIAAKPGLPENVPGTLRASQIFGAEALSGVGTKMGAFAQTVLRHPDAVRSDHPAFSFAALGSEALTLTQNAPFHYPLGSDSPPARLHKRNGWILLLGTDQTVNISLNLAEVWANVPYIHRSTPILTEDGGTTEMLGSPECRVGFAKIEPLLRQSRILRSGYIGNAESRLMRQQQVISMAVAMLNGQASALLCDNENCRPCSLARKMTAEQRFEPI